MSENKFDEVNFGIEKRKLIEKLESMNNCLSRINDHLNNITDSSIWNETGGYSISYCRVLNGMLIENYKNMESIRTNIDTFMETVKQNYCSDQDRGNRHVQ